MLAVIIEQIQNKWYLSAKLVASTPIQSKCSLPFPATFALNYDSPSIWWLFELRESNSLFTLQIQEAGGSKSEQVGTFNI